MIEKYLKIILNEPREVLKSKEKAETEKHEKSERQKNINNRWVK